MSQIENPSTSTANPALRPRRWLRFSLRTFLLFTLILGMFFGWLGNILIRVRHQREIIARIEAAGGQARLEYQLDVKWREDSWKEASPPGPWIVRILVGDDAYAYVEYVDFREERVTDTDLDCLSELPHLKEVSIYGPKVTDNGIVQLLRIPKLQGLNLSRTSVTSTGIGRLSAANELTTLVLYGPGVTDETLTTVDQLTQLRSLSLHRTNVSSAGLAPVSRLIGLESLVITQTPSIDDDATRHIAPLKNLHVLQLMVTGVTDDGLARLTELSQLQLLDLMHCNVTDTGMQHITALPELLQLELIGTKVGDGGISELPRLPKIQRLSLAGTQITDAAAVYLAKLQNLRWLDLAGTSITDASLENVSLLHDLRLLRLQRTSVTDEGLNSLRTLRNLESLELGPKVTKAGAVALKRVFPKCEIEWIGPTNVISHISADSQMPPVAPINPDSPPVP